MELLELLVLVRLRAVDREMHRLGGDALDVGGRSEVVLVAMGVLEDDAVEDVLVARAATSTTLPMLVPSLVTTASPVLTAVHAICSSAMRLIIEPV